MIRKKKQTSNSQGIKVESKKERKKKTTRVDILEAELTAAKKYNDTKEVQRLEESISRSKKGKGARNKGASYERKIASVFKEILGIELTRTPQSGGFAKKSTKAADFRGDITCLDESVDFLLHVECKNQKTMKLLDWIRQSESDCPEGRKSLVVFHRPQRNVGGKVDKADDYVCLKLTDFLDLVSIDSIVKDRAKGAK